VKINPNQFKISLLLALAYTAIGTYEIMFDGNISRQIDQMSDGLDLYVVFPSHLFGSMFWLITDSSVFGWVGQLIGLVFWTILIYGTLQLWKILLSATSNPNQP
jgi:hypothetical protein